MRAVWLGCFLLCFACLAWGQDQERKLIDRLLKPDMSLQNTAQNKKFGADKATADKHARVETFYLQEKSKPKTFYGTREYASSQFDTRSYNTKKANTSSRTTLPNNRYATSPVKVSASPDATRKKETRDYADNGPFRDQGKSQKALTQQNQPMTIEEVRELLNRNK